MVRLCESYRALLLAGARARLVGGRPSGLGNIDGFDRSQLSDHDYRDARAHVAVRNFAHRDVHGILTLALDETVFIPLPVTLAEQSSPERVATIVRRHIAEHHVETIYLVGGTVLFPGMAAVVEAITGVRTLVPGEPLFVTPLGIAMHD